MTQCVGFQQSWLLSGAPASAGDARRLLRQSLADPIYADLLDDAQLAVTEIVTNVILHTDSDLILTIRAEHGRLCVQIRDDSPVLPIEREYGAEATTGRGIALVRQVTSAYGAQAVAGGSKIVWFVIGPVHVPGSSWPFLDGPAENAPADGQPGDPLPAEQSNAIQIVLSGASPTLWQGVLEELSGLLRELKLFQAEHPTEGITPSELAIAELVGSHGILAVEHAVLSSLQVDPAQVSVSFWATPQQAQQYAALNTMFAKAERLADRGRLLQQPSAPEHVALREWAITQIVGQLAGEPAQPWDQDENRTTAPTVIAGWDRTTVDAAEQHVIAVDRTNRIAAVSPSLAVLLGWQVKDLVGRRTTTLIPAQLREAHLAAFQGFLSTGCSALLDQTLELPMLHADGHELLCLATITQVGTLAAHPVFSATVTAVASPDPDAPGDGPQRAPRTGPSADLSSFTVGDMARMAAGMRHLGEGATSIESFATTICRTLYDRFRDGAGNRQAVLVRFYATAPLRQLPDAEQAVAAQLVQGTLPADTTCIALLGTAGNQPSWNDRTASRSSRVMPLTDTIQLTALPVMTALMDQLGIDPSVVLNQRNNFELPVVGERYGIFHVADNTVDATHPAHGFYRKHRIASMIGFGGALPSGGLFGVMVFSRTAVTHESAQMFETLAHSTTYGCFAKSGIPVFEDGPRTDRTGHSLSACQRMATQKDILAKLLQAYERVTTDQSDATTQALERAHFETQRYATLARTLQATLFPAELPVVPCVQTGAFFRPAGDGSEIGGDFYDLFAVSADRFGFVLGDVSGKGAEAAAVTSLARHTVRAVAFAAATPCQVLRDLDQSFSVNDTDGRYLTALFAFVTPEPGSVALHLALGGHPRPFVLRADGSVEAVGVEGGALGLFPEPSFTGVTVALRSGDTFVAYSDGVTEARRDDEEFGEGRLRTLLAAQRGRTAQEIATTIGTDVLDFQHGTAHDDTAVVVLRCL